MTDDPTLAPAMVRAARLALEKAALAALLASHQAQAEVEHHGRILRVSTLESKRMGRRAAAWGRLAAEIAEVTRMLEELERSDVDLTASARRPAEQSASRALA